MLKIFFPLYLLSFFFVDSTSAATTANATVTFTITALDAITVSGSPGPLVVNDAVAGNPPTADIDTATTYAVTTNNTSRRVTGRINTAMPTGLTLSVALAAPTGATSTGNITLTTTAVSLVTGITRLAQGALTITYQLAATVSAAQVSGLTRTVTYTIGA